MILPDLPPVVVLSDTATRAEVATATAAAIRDGAHLWWARIEGRDNVAVWEPITEIAVRQHRLDAHFIGQDRDGRHGWLVLFEVGS